MKKVNIKAGGRVISELSEKIPSNIVALNELIKNSYDAFAKTVIITLDTKSQFLTIQDNGIGLSLDAIDKLFHIGYSDKFYGVTIRNNELGIERITQGSKGLGFLSAFKFGSNVWWETKHDNSGYTFTANREEIIALQDISDYSISLKPNEAIPAGTIIKIQLDSYNAKTLRAYFAEEKNREKILNSFLDDGFKIYLTIDKDKYSSSNAKTFKEILKDKQLFQVTYSSNESIIKFFRNGALINEVVFSINSEQYDLNLDLIIFSFDKGDTAKVAKLFDKSNSEQAVITPLIYINNNLFNNFELFDPEIMRKARGNRSLPQIIGYIKIKSSHKDLEFNSDRTHFVQNELTDNIKSNLEALNRKIQEIGVALKKKSSRWASTFPKFR